MARERLTCVLFSFSLILDALKFRGANIFYHRFNFFNIDRERVTLKFQIELPLLRYCSEKYIKFGVALHKFETSIQNSAADNTCRVLGLLGLDYKRSGAQCPDT